MQAAAGDPVVKEVGATASAAAGGPARLLDQCAEPPQSRKGLGNGGLSIGPVLDGPVHMGGGHLGHGERTRMLATRDRGQGSAEDSSRLRHLGNNRGRTRIGSGIKHKGRQHGAGRNPRVALGAFGAFPLLQPPVTVVLRKGRLVVELAVVGPSGRESPWEGRKPFQLLIFSRMRLVSTSLLLHDWLNIVAGPVVARGGAVTGAPLNAVQGGPTGTRNDAGRNVEAVGGCIATSPVDRAHDGSPQAGRQRKGKQH